MLINGQEWQDINAYESFIKNQLENPVNLVKKDGDNADIAFERLLGSLKKGEDYITAHLYSKSDHIIYPGDSALIQTGLPMELICDYYVQLQLIQELEFYTWLRVSSSLVPQRGLGMMDIQNLAQYYLARKEHFGYFSAVSEGENSVYVVHNLAEISRVVYGGHGYQRPHIAYHIRPDDEIAQLVLRKK